MISRKTYFFTVVGFLILLVSSFLYLNSKQQFPVNTFDPDYSARLTSLRNNLQDEINN